MQELPCGESLLRSQSPGKRARWCAWAMERPASNRGNNVQWGSVLDTSNKNVDKTHLHWNKECNRKQSTGGPSLEASNVISDIHYLENGDLIFRGADRVLPGSFDNLETKISPFRAKCLYQDEMNHIVKLRIFSQCLWEETVLSTPQDRMAALEAWKIKRGGSPTIACKCFGRYPWHVMFWTQRLAWRKRQVPYVPFRVSGEQWDPQRQRTQVVPTISQGVHWSLLTRRGDCLPEWHVHVRCSSLGRRPSF